jgi:uncharacterized protein
MKLAIDFDGVLCNTIQKWIEIFNSDYSKKYHNLKLSYNQIAEFDFYKKFNITHDDSRQIFQTCWESWDTLQPIEFFLDQKTKKLSELCDGMDIVTANDSINKEYLVKFLQKYSIKYDDIVFEENKESLHYDIFIDDSPINAQKILDSGKSVFLYNQPWNQNIVELEPKLDNIKNVQISRVYNLDHTIHILQNYLRLGHN